MANFLTCLQTAIDNNLVNPEKGALAKETFNLEKASGKNDYEAAESAVDILSNLTDAKRREKIASIKGTAKLIDDFATSNDPADTVIKKGIQLHVAMDRNRRRIHAAGAKFLVDTKRDVFGVAPVEKLDNILEASFGAKTGDQSAEELLDAAIAMENMAIQLVNKQGASMKPNTSRRFPVRPTEKKIYMRKRARAKELEKSGMDPAAAGKQAFEDVQKEYVELTRRIIDWGMQERDVPIPQANRDSYLYRMFEIHASGGKILKGPKVTIQESLAGRLSRSTGVYVKDAASWREFNEKFGEGDIFTQLITNVELLARDAALMEVFTPNAFNGMQMVKNLAQKRASLLDRYGTKRRTHGGKVADANAELEAGFKTFSHGVNMAHENWGAQTIATLRNVGGVAVMGGAAISNVGDASFGFMAKHEAGLPSNTWMKSFFHALKEGGSREGQIALIQSGAGAESFASQTLIFERFQGFFDGPQWTKRLGDSFHRITGLIPYTQRMEWGWTHDMHYAFGRLKDVEWGADYADDIGKTFKVDNFWAALERYDITKEDWDIFRKTPVHKEAGGDFGESLHIRPIDVFQRTDIDEDTANRVGERFMDYILHTQRLAVPKVGFREAAHLGAATDRSLMIGMVQQLFSSVKGFSTVILFTHLGWVFKGFKQSWRQGFTRFGLMSLSTILAGAFITQVKEMLLRGRDPLPMNNVGFWVKAYLNGGSMGLLGDAVLNNVSSYRGGGLSQVFAGPIVDQMSAFRDLTIGNLADWQQGKETKVGKDLLEFMGLIAPIPWQAQLLYDRAMFEPLLAKIDPVAYRRMLQRARQLETERGQSSWWRRGALTPERTPDFLNILNQPE